MRRHALCEEKRKTSHRPLYSITCIGGAGVG